MSMSSRLYQLLLPTTPQALLFHLFLAILVVAARFFFHLKAYGELPQAKIDSLIHPACTAPDVTLQLTQCVFNHEEIVQLLLKGSVGGNNPDFHKLVRQYMRLPTAWGKVPDLVGTGRPWTRKYCDTLDDDDVKAYVYTGESFPFLQLHRMPASTLIEVVTAFVKRTGFLEEPELKQMASALKFADPNDFEGSLAVVSRIFHYLHAKPLEHLAVACEGSSRWLSPIRSTDSVGRTALHIAADAGDPFACKALVQTLGVEDRTAFVDVVDSYGYTAEDDASRGQFEEVVQVLRSLGSGNSSTAPQEPASMFPAEEQHQAGHEEVLTGGWDTDSSLVPPAWLPEEGEGCSIDTIPEHVFDDWVFFRHYWLHKRPLLIRNGARELAANKSLHWSRERLVAAVGDFPVRAFSVPHADVYHGATPKGFVIREYVDYLERRRSKNLSAESNLQYVYVPLPEEDSEMSWARPQPPILEGRLRKLVATHFYLGGTLMGTPPHHHHYAFNSLVHGRKLWFLRPPSQPIFSTEVVHRYLASGKGRGAMRCVQEPGDLLFVPAGWSHAAMCLDDCIGVSHEFGAFRVEHKSWFDRKRERA